MKDPDRDTQRGMGEGYSLLSVGMTFAFSLVGFVLLGIWLDGKWRTTPLWTLIFTLFGTGLSMFWLLQRLKRANRGDGGPR